jgi:hypothetical protein
MTFTRNSVAGIKGYDARKAEELFRQFPYVSAVIVSDLAVSKRAEGADLVWRKGTLRTTDSGILYYRKSSGGKWGRSVQLELLIPRSETNA